MTTIAVTTLLLESRNGERRIIFASDTAMTRVSQNCANGHIDLGHVHRAYNRGSVAMRPSRRSNGQRGGRASLPVHHQTFRLSFRQREPNEHFRPHGAGLLGALRCEIGETFLAASSACAQRLDAMFCPIRADVARW